MKLINLFVWLAIAAIVLWSMSFGTMEVLGFKKCQNNACNKWVRGKSEYRVVKDRWVFCNECYETWRVAQ